MFYQVHYHLKDLMTELQQTNLEKTLLAWCRQNTQVMSRCKNYTEILSIIKINKRNIFLYTIPLFSELSWC